MDQEPTPADTGLDPAVLADLAGIVLADRSLDDVLGTVAHLARACGPDGAEVSVTLLRGEQPHTVACTSDLARELDEAQYEHGYGPCLEAARSGGVLSVEDMATDGRWPEMAAGALARGASSSLSVPLPLQEHVVGAINSYAGTAHAFDAAAVERARTFAGYAAVAVANARVYRDAADLAAQLRQAMESRAVIDQAKGILMAVRGISAEEAFAALTSLSQNSNRKLRDIAAAVVEGRGQGLA